MKKSIKYFAFLLSFLVIGGAQAMGKHESGQTFVIQMLGQSVSVGDVGQIDEREGTSINFDKWEDYPGDFSCFEMPLINPNAGIQIGTGIDCLRFDDTSMAPDKILVTAYSFFVTPGGTLVNRGTTSIRALEPGWGDGGDPQRTHATGSIPDPKAKTLIAGTGMFKKAKGRARVSGAVNPNFATPFFDCLWKIEVELKQEKSKK
jgi:hypothetical protein